MKRILFTVIPEKGHINPAIGVAQRLQAMGHEISFHAVSDISPQLQLAGLENFLGPKTTDPSNQGAAFTQAIRDKAWLRQWIKTLLIDRAPAAIPGYQKLFTGFDLIVTDPMIYPAVIASETAGIPWVALSNSLNPVLNDDIHSDLLDTVAWLSPDRDTLFQSRGITQTFRGCDALSPHLTIAFATPEFIGLAVPGVELVGPSKPLSSRGDETDFPWQLIKPGVPIVYLSFGSQIYHQPGYFRKIIEAVTGKDVQLIAAAHDLEIPDIPPNVILTGYSPQLAILEKATAIITHGGANSVMEALASDTPVLIHPICNDQFHQAWFLEKSGTGRRLDLDAMTPIEIWEQIQWALQADISHVSASYRTDGADRAATLIAGL